MLLILLSIIVNYSIAVQIGKSKDIKQKKTMWLILGLVYDLGMLFFFKYINFMIDNINAMSHGISNLQGVTKIHEIAPLSIALPLGISFYTFQVVSYVIDVYQGRIQAERSIFKFALYVSMFPQLISGPIVTYSDIDVQLIDRKYSFKKFEKGLKIFIIGLGLKVLIADRIAFLWNDIQTIGFESISTPLAWLGAIGYSLQLYFDFHGYTLMAIGVGKMIGFNLPNNFNHPYMSKSVTEFWRRWHITLGTWFKNYVYIPMGGNRRGTARLAFNLFIVWMLTGLWHGASWNYVLWGLLLFALIYIEKMFLKKKLDQSRFLARIYMLVIIPVSWMLFAINNLSDVGTYFGRMFAVVPGINVNAYDFIKYVEMYKWLFLLGIFFSMPYAWRWFVKHESSIPSIVFLVVVFWFSIYQLANGSNNPFMYFKF
ncbi:MBOAT family O-acyltransferase [Anaeromicropila herbilytica]|uniref:MBOAT family O-acyltransferase n=1 Tax=Anaeromicropila herbilytica TaxID=2785025 RepID=UPI002ED26A6D